MPHSCVTDSAPFCESDFVQSNGHLLTEQPIDGTEIKLHRHGCLTFKLCAKGS
eukprot:c41970_g1_i1 orf=79-237(-)